MFRMFFFTIAASAGLVLIGLLIRWLFLLCFRSITKNEGDLKEKLKEMEKGLNLLSAGYVSVFTTSVICGSVMVALGSGLGWGKKLEGLGWEFMYWGGIAFLVFLANGIMFALVSTTVEHLKK